ncbi:MAG: PEGA domain-containing protein [Myxococcaceae bacterium]
MATRSNRFTFVALLVVLLAGVAVCVALVKYLGPKTVEAPAEAVPVKGTAKLHVTTQPDVARIELDRQVMGSSPLDLEGLTAGHHSVVATSAGHLPGKKDVELKEGESASLTMVLEPVKPPPEAPAVAETDAGTAPEFGLLDFDTTPHVSVFIRGRALGETPLKGVKLPPGKYVLRLVSPEKKIDRGVPVEIKAGQTTAKKLSL